MKFLIDRCAGRRIAEWLSSLGHDVIETRSLGQDPGDRVILDWAAGENRILVTIDTDFGKLVYVISFSGFLSQKTRKLTVISCQLTVKACCYQSILNFPKEPFECRSMPSAFKRTATPDN